GEHGERERDRDERDGDREHVVERREHHETDDAHAVAVREQVGRVAHELASGRAYRRKRNPSSSTNPCLSSHGAESASPPCTAGPAVPATTRGASVRKTSSTRPSATIAPASVGPPSASTTLPESCATSCARSTNGPGPARISGAATLGSPVPSGSTSVVCPDANKPA